MRSVALLALFLTGAAHAQDALPEAVRVRLDAAIQFCDTAGREVEAEGPVRMSATRVLAYFRVVRDHVTAVTEAGGGDLSGMSHLKHRVNFELAEAFASDFHWNAQTVGELLREFRMRFEHARGDE